MRLWWLRHHITLPREHCWHCCIAGVVGGACRNVQNAAVVAAPPHHPAALLALLELLAAPAAACDAAVMAASASTASISPARRSATSCAMRPFPSTPITPASCATDAALLAGTSISMRGCARSSGTRTRELPPAARLTLPDPYLPGPPPPPFPPLPAPPLTYPPRLTYPPALWLPLPPAPRRSGSRGESAIAATAGDGVCGWGLAAAACISRAPCDTETSTTGIAAVRLSQSGRNGPLLAALACESSAASAAAPPTPPPPSASGADAVLVPTPLSPPPPLPWRPERSIGTPASAARERSAASCAAVAAAGGATSMRMTPAAPAAWSSATCSGMRRGRAAGGLKKSAAAESGAAGAAAMRFYAISIVHIHQVQPGCRSTTCGDGGGRG
eukprot:364532-Chlamydomonas_euryale.AAC.5